MQSALGPHRGHCAWLTVGAQQSFVEGTFLAMEGIEKTWGDGV